MWHPEVLASTHPKNMASVKVKAAARMLRSSAQQNSVTVQAAAATASGSTTDGTQTTRLLAQRMMAFVNVQIDKTVARTPLVQGHLESIQNAAGLLPCHWHSTAQIFHSVGGPQFMTSLEAGLLPSVYGMGTKLLIADDRVSCQQDGV